MVIPFFQKKKEFAIVLGAIKGLGVVALKEIFRVRKEKKFVDLFDFCIRVSRKIVNRKTLEALIYSGCFDEFGQDRAILLASIDVALRSCCNLVKPIDGEQGDLFEDVELSLRPKYMEVEPISEEDKLRLEKEVIGFYLSNHPVSIYEKWFTSLDATLLHDITGKTHLEDVLFILMN